MTFLSYLIEKLLSIYRKFISIFTLKKFKSLFFSICYLSFGFSIFFALFLIQEPVSYSSVKEWRSPAGILSPGKLMSLLNHPLTFGAVIVYLYETGLIPEVDFQALMNGESVPGIESKVDLTPFLPIDPNHTPIHSEFAEELSFSQGGGSRSQKSELLQSIHSRSIMQKGENVFDTVSYRDAWSKRKRFRRLDDDVKEYYIFNSRGFARERLERLNKDLGLLAHERERVELAVRLLFKARILPAPTSSDILIPDFNVCVGRSSPVVRLVKENPIADDHWHLLVCHQFFEVGHRLVASGPPAVVGGRMLSFVMLVEAGMDRERAFRLAYAPN